MFSSFITSGPPRGHSGAGPQDTPDDASTLAVKLMLASLGMLFLASIVGYVITRYHAARSGDPWVGYKTPGLHAGLALSTVMLVGCSITLHRGVAAVRRGDQRRFRRMLGITWALSLVFLGNQVVNWMQLYRHQLDLPAHDLSVFLFAMMTGLHAAHVIGGFVPLAIVSARARAGRYGPGRSRGVHNLAIYWHFLDGVWLMIAAALFIG